jgi:hypothetical protein
MNLPRILIDIELAAPLSAQPRKLVSDSDSVWRVSVYKDGQPVDISEADLLLVLGTPQGAAVAEFTGVPGPDNHTGDIAVTGLPAANLAYHIEVRWHSHKIIHERGLLRVHPKVRT